MLSKLFSPFKKMIYKNLPVRAFVVTRLNERQIREKVFIVTGKERLDISSKHSIICLDPFCIAIWLSPAEAADTGNETLLVEFTMGSKTRARARLKLKEIIKEQEVVLQVYEVIQAGSYQLNAFSRFLTLNYFLRNKTSRYHDRKVIAALYSFPRKIIIVSCKDDDYCNIFPMDIQGFVTEGGLYVLGLRNSNFALEKILKTKKLVIADSGDADIKTVYALGKHLSVSPPAIHEFPFKTFNSEQLQFPLPMFINAYKEVEIIHHRNLGYHMMLVGRITNAWQQSALPSSLYHLHLFEFMNSGYENVSDEIY